MQKHHPNWAFSHPTFTFLSHVIKFTKLNAFQVLLVVGGGGQGGLNLPLPVPFNPGSRPVFFGSRPFAFFRLRNIAQCCVIFPLFSRLPYTSRPLFSRSPAPLSPTLVGQGRHQERH